MSLVIIAGSQVDLDHPDVKKASTVADVAKLGIFSHLEDDKRKEAEQNLFDAKTNAAKASVAKAPEETPVDKEKDKEKH